jgi:hypothetical protein
VFDEDTEQQCPLGKDAAVRKKYGRGKKVHARGNNPLSNRGRNYGSVKILVLEETVESLSSELWIGTENHGGQKSHPWI